MVDVNTRTANWRLFGGGGLALAGLVGLGGLVAREFGASDLYFWLWNATYVLLAIALLFVAFGQTGSNGAVGASRWGKAVLVLAAVAAIVSVILRLTVGGAFIQARLGVLAVLLLLSAIAVFSRGVAGGIAKWALFVPALAAIARTVGLMFPENYLQWMDWVYAAGLFLTGLAYVLNRAGSSRK